MTVYLVTYAKPYLSVGFCLCEKKRTSRPDRIEIKSPGKYEIYPLNYGRETKRPNGIIYEVK